MRRFSVIIATSAAMAVLTQTAGAYATSEETPDPATAGPSTAVVLGDIAAALAEQPAGPIATDQVLADAPGEEVAADLPETGADSAEATTAVGTLTMDIPAAGTDLAPASEATALFDGTAPATTVAVQNTTEGLRALVHIDSLASPERFDFPIGGDVTALRPTEDGGVEALNANGEVIMTAPAPWATDANGVAVPTHYEVNGTTLTQVVEHHAGTYAYGIVADPWWNPFSWDWGKIWSKSKSAIAGTLKKCGQGALVSTLGLAVGTGTANVLITRYSSKIAMVKVGGVYGYIGVAAAGCIMNNL